MAHPCTEAKEKRADLPQQLLLIHCKKKKKFVSIYFQKCDQGIWKIDTDSY